VRYIDTAPVAGGMPVGTDSVVASFPTVFAGTPPMRKSPPCPAEQFQSMLEALRNDGMTPTDIAREAGISRATVWRLSVGDSRQVSYQVGHSIERLFRERRR
jgi:hypothetical protein